MINTKLMGSLIDQELLCHAASLSNIATLKAMNEGREFCLFAFPQGSYEYRMPVTVRQWLDDGAHGAPVATSDAIDAMVDILRMYPELQTADPLRSQAAEWLDTYLRHPVSEYSTVPVSILACAVSDVFEHLDILDMKHVG